MLNGRIQNPNDPVKIDQSAFAGSSWKIRQDVHPVLPFTIDLSLISFVLGGSYEA